MSRVLVPLQAAIERLHDVATDLDVGAYVVDEETRRQIPGARDGLPEQLFIREDEEGVEIALYVDPQVMRRLQIDPPQRRLHAGNLEAYCIALEGVSHFVFLAWRARLGRPVSALELEIQAEVDKFVSAWLLLHRQGRPLPHVGPPLVRRIFEQYELREDVPSEESGRYHTANRAARDYCAGLVKRYSRDRDVRRIRRDVREFYRRGLADKLRAA